MDIRNALIGATGLAKAVEFDGNTAHVVSTRGCVFDLNLNGDPDETRRKCAERGVILPERAVPIIESPVIEEAMVETTEVVAPTGDAEVLNAILDRYSARELKDFAKAKELDIKLNQKAEVIASALIEAGAFTEGGEFIA